jgi:hypothetical protein
MINSTTNGASKTVYLTETANLRQTVEEIVKNTPVIDIHTHLFAPEFGEMNLFGIDELLTYHYLVAEMFRSANVKPERFWQLAKAEKANLVWQTLFVENTPLSEATMGIITVLNELGLNPNAKDLNEIRDFFRSQNISEHIDRILKLAAVSRVVMTNDPFDAEEIKIWENNYVADERFYASLRMDRLLNNWDVTAAQLAATGFQVNHQITGQTASKIRHFLDSWIEKMNPLYMAVSLPDDFSYFVDDPRNQIIRQIVLPLARDHKLPFAMMIGVRRKVNPALHLAGDGVGRADVKSLEQICLENPDVNFLATFLSRENQHELCVSARKFSNLMPFGCWWFLNNPSIVSEMTAQRIEMLGTSFIPQHSDARVLEQLIYKWKHSRRDISKSLFRSYERLMSAGRAVTKGEIERDVTRMFSGNFNNLTAPFAEISIETRG